MAKVTQNDFWFLAIVHIFLPLTGKNGVADSDCESIDYQLTDTVRYLNFPFFHNNMLETEFEM